MMRALQILLFATLLLLLLSPQTLGTLLLLLSPQTLLLYTHAWNN